MKSTPEENGSTVAGSRAVDGLVEIEANARAERSNNTLRAYREIKRRILSSEMIAGEQFLEQELAELLNMSRTPVREALIRLAEERLVEVRPRHGVRILPQTADDIREIYELLTELELHAVRRITDLGLSDRDDDALMAALNEMNTSLETGNVQSWATAERTFHDHLLKAANNSRLYVTARILVDQAHQARLHFLTHTPPASDISRGYAKLLDALRRKDSNEAQRLNRQQLIESGRGIIDLMKRNEGAKA